MGQHGVTPRLVGGSTGSTNDASVSPLALMPSADPHSDPLTDPHADPHADAIADAGIDVGAHHGAAFMDDGDVSADNVEVGGGIVVKQVLSARVSGPEDKGNRISIYGIAWRERE